MPTCLTFEDIVAAGEPGVDQLRTVGNSFPNSEAPGACEAFTTKVRMVESSLIHTYALAASFSRKCDKSEEVAGIWGRMSDFCSGVMESLASLKDKYPYCGTPELYDRTLDYKLACEKRQRNILEEIQCQKNKIPKGLFPA